MRIAITGSTGLIGTAVREALLARGHEVTRVVRSLTSIPPGEHAVVWHPDTGEIETQGLENHDVVIHLAGESLAGVWTSGKKRRIVESRKRGTTLISRSLASLESKPALLLSASAIGIYGNREPDEELTEAAAPGTGFLADIGKIWEAGTEPAGEAGIRVVHMRISNVLSPRGGMLATLLPIFRLGFGAPFGDGSQIWSWIALDDAVAAIFHLIDNENLRGPVNLAAPNAVTNNEFTRALAAAVQRPAVLRIPAFAARFAPGGMGEEILLAGARVVPQALLDSGFTFAWPELQPALKAMVK
jgi:uncharacterized protein (TIGR01777 family)